MTRTERAVAGALLAAALAEGVGAGCFWRKSPPPGPPPPLVYRLCIEASPRLNWYNESAHTLYVRLFQLSSVDAFQESDPGKLLDQQLALAGLEGAPIERQIYPGTTVTIEVTQKPNATSLGLVGGYYRASGPAKWIRALEADTEEGKQKSKEKGKDKDKNAPAKPDCIHVGLGPNGIETPAS
jgi:type VI secretion system VasD/TssJ family lipoprotein